MSNLDCRFAVLILVPLFVAGCGPGDEISGSYQGTETTQLIRSGAAERGAARTQVTVEAGDDELRVAVAGCRLTLEIAALGVAELTPGATCTVNSGNDSGVLFSLELGEATYGDGNFALTLLGIADDGARWEYTFSGNRE